MKSIVLRYLLLASVVLFSCQSEKKQKHPQFPSIFLVPEKTQGLTSVEELQNTRFKGLQAELWNDLVKKSELDLQLEYIDPTIYFEGRSPVQLKHGNVSYDMENGVSERLLRLALMSVLTEEEKYKKAVLKQIEALYDTARWPLWCDHAHVNIPPDVDIRTCQISKAVALSFNWMNKHLSAQEKAFIIEGLDKRAIQPFWEKLAQKPGWYTHRHNWFTNIFSGMAITAMALGDNHPDTERLLDTIVPQMIAFNEVFGNEGEFNEPPGYSGAIRFSVEFSEAYRYYTGNTRNLLNEKPFPEACFWVLFHTLPPGRLAAFGDTPIDKKMAGLAVMAAVANANSDELLQDYYISNFEELSSTLEFLWFNPSLPAKNPQGILPLGKSYNDWGAGIVSRTSWNPDWTECVVYGKAGREGNHDDNDVGQLLVDAFGERLIIDPGKPDPIYPKDYFSATQYEYYTRSSIGHNVLVIGGEEMISEPNDLARGKLLQTFFNDSIGSAWEMDLSPVYENAQHVSRKVIHLFPGIIAVHDVAELENDETIDLRWHCITSPETFDKNEFFVKGEKAALSAKIISLDDNTLTLSTGFQEFKSPYNKSRQGDLLVQRNEPFVKISTKGKSCSILILFAAVENQEELPRWTKENNSWEITSKGETFTIQKQNGKFVASASNRPETTLEF